MFGISEQLLFYGQNLINWLTFYNLEQVNKIQASKQADIMVLFYLLEELFLVEVKQTGNIMSQRHFTILHDHFLYTQC